MSFFRSLAGDAFACFRGTTFGWHVGAWFLTFICVVSGIDWQWYLATDNIRMYLFPAAVVGGLVPLVAPFITYAVGFIAKSQPWKTTALALGRAEILAFLISGFYKALTGRPGPVFASGVPTDITQVFRFGWWRGGVFWGWPSTHTTLAFATGVMLYILLRKKTNRLVAFVPLIYALYIGIGVSGTIHWFSDFIAGAILGSLIGVVVGTRTLTHETTQPV